MSDNDPLKRISVHVRAPSIEHTYFYMQIVAERDIVKANTASACTNTNTTENSWRLMNASPSDLQFGSFFRRAFSSMLFNHSFHHTISRHVFVIFNYFNSQTENIFLNNFRDFSNQHFFPQFLSKRNSTGVFVCAIFSAESGIFQLEHDQILNAIDATGKIIKFRRIDADCRRNGKCTIWRFNSLNFISRIPKKN